MEDMKIAELIAALNLVGHILRSKDGAKPADAVTKILKQLDGAPEATLAEWAERKRSKPKGPSKKPTKATKANLDSENIDKVLMQLAGAETQHALHIATSSIKLSAAEWQGLARKLTGKSGRSGKAAREQVETYYSNQLLLQDRLESIRS
jgi:hypothetical protein